jgi:hypothetical protein
MLLECSNPTPGATRYTPYNKVEQMFRNYRIGRTELETDKHILFQFEREGMHNPAYIEKMFDL